MIDMFEQVEKAVRARLANNGRNPANNNAGIRVGSDLHLCEILLAEIDRLKAIVELWQDYPTISARLAEFEKMNASLLLRCSELQEENERLQGYE
jgi:hypothetical protein